VERKALFDITLDFIVVLEGSKDMYKNKYLSITSEMIFTKI
jgi:hypothetical protein